MMQKCLASMRITDGIKFDMAKVDAGLSLGEGGKSVEDGVESLFEFCKVKFILLLYALSESNVIHVCDMKSM